VRIWAFAVSRWQFTLVMFFMMVALGAFALKSIPRQEDPSFPIPVVTTVVTFPGASAIDVERLAVDPIEDAIAELDDVKEIRSTSEDGLGVVVVEFEWTVDPEKKYDEVVREVNARRSRMPAEIRDITMRKSSPGLVNIVQFSLVSDTASPMEFKQQSKRLKDMLETLPGVRRSETWAYPEPEIRIELDLARLAEMRINLGTVLEAVQGEGTSVPAGALDVGDRRYTLRTTGDYESIDEVADTVIASRQGRLVHLRDVAQVRWDTEEVTYVGRYNGRRAAFVTANMKDGESIFDVHDQIADAAADFERDLPPGMTLMHGFEQVKNVAHRLSRLGMDFGIAMALVSLTLLPLGLRAAGVVMIAIPLSLAMGVAGLWLLGFSLNQISIAGFVLALGLLVDDAIVVVENITRHLRDGKRRMAAAIEATDQIALAVLGCTITLILAFIPLLNLPEGAGKFTRGLPLAVVLTVTASLLVAYTIVPFLASRMLPRHEHAEGNAILRWLKRGIHVTYAPMVHAALRWPVTSLVLSLALCVSSLGLVKVLGFSLFPSADKPQFLINVKAPEGASLQATDRAVRFVEDELLRHPEVLHVMANVGKGNPYIYYNIFPGETRASTGQLFVTLDRWNPRQTPQLLERLRERFASYAEAQIVLRQFENGPPIEAPIAVRVVGPRLDDTREVAAQVEAIMRRTPGTRDVVNPVRLQRIDYDLGIDREKAGLLSLDSLDVDRAVRLAVAGVPASTYRDAEGEEYDITVRGPVQGSPTRGQLEGFRLVTRTGEVVSLAQIAEPHFVSVTSRIERLNRERMVTITSNVQDGFVTGKVAEKIYAELAGMTLPPGYRIDAGGEKQAAAKSFAGLGTAALVAVFGILAVLVLEFGSFRSTLIVVGVIPFGVLGAMIALAVTGNSLSYMAILGLIALIGVEIKNSILLVDFTNQLRREGVGLDEAIETAGELRFLPVLLTSVTAIGGLLPLALSGSALYSPLAIVMIGGLISSTVMARVITPVMYKLLPPVIVPMTDD
jgi:multidrug efflux pump subunit AcrB